MSQSKEKPKIFDVKSNITGNGEHILGFKDTGSHACYLIYGVMKPGEKGRKIKPGNGHEELLLAMKGDFSLTGDFEGVVKEGQAVHLKDDECCSVENISDRKAVYIISGGHSERGHH
jgi:hypothetical protein